MDKKRKASADLEGSEDIKRQKIDASQEVDPPLTDLPADPLLHLLNFVGARGLLTLATTCSKFKSIVDSRLQSYIKRIFSVGFDELLDPANRAKSVQALKRAAKTEEAFGYRVKVMSLVPAADEKPAPPNWGRQRNPLRTPYQLLKWDDHKLAHISRNYRRCTITCTETGGKMCTVDFENDVTHFASSSMGQIAFVVTTPEGSDKVLVYAFDEYYSPSLIGSFVRNNLNGQLHNIAWTASNDLVLVRSTLYELCTITGESLRTKLFEFNEEGAVHMVVSPDGMFAIRAQYEFSGEPATFYQIDIAAGTEKRVFSIESVADFMEHLQFVGNNPDLLTWYIEGTGQSAIFLYNLKTKKKRLWAVNTGVNDISLDGKKVVAQQDYDYSDMRATCRILETETNKQLGDLLKFPENPKGPEVGQFFMTYYNWTYPITNTAGPSEKLLATGDDRVNVFDPQTGKHIAQVKYFDVNVFLRLAAISSDNRTLVFSGDPVMNTNISNTVVWHFY